MPKIRLLSLSFSMTKIVNKGKTANRNYKGRTKIRLYNKSGFKNCVATMASSNYNKILDKDYFLDRDNNLFVFINFLK